MALKTPLPHFLAWLQLDSFFVYVAAKPWEGRGRGGVTPCKSDSFFAMVEKSWWKCLSCSGLNENPIAERLGILCSELTDRHIWCLKYLTISVLWRKTYANTTQYSILMGWLYNSREFNQNWTGLQKAACNPTLKTRNSQLSLHLINWRGLDPIIAALQDS